MKWWKKVWRTGWKVLLAGLATFLLLEALLTFFPGVFFPERFYVYDPDMGFRVKPHGRYGHVRANEFGFNDRDYPHQPAPGVYRILIVSDSFNWAAGPVGNYTNVLEERFAEVLGQGRVEVISAGYSMTHTVEQLEMLKKFGLQYNPDLVVLGFFAGNDFFDAHPNRRRIGYGGTFVDYNTEEDWFFEVFGQPVVLQSRLFAFLDEKWVLWRTQRRIEQERQSEESEQSSERTQASPERQDAGLQTREARQSEPQQTAALDEQVPPTMSRGEYLRVSRFLAEFALVEEAAKFNPHVEYIVSAISEMKSLLGERGIPLLVAAYPAEWQVDEGLQKEMLAQYGMAESQFQWTRAQTLLADFCRRNGIEFLDLTPAFQTALGQGQTVYHSNDTHWNYAGNRLAAKELFEILAPKVRAGLSPAAATEGTLQGRR